METDVFVFDLEKGRPACVLLAAVFGGNPSFAHHFPSDSWIIDGDLSGLERFGPTTHSEVRALAERLYPVERA